MVQARVLAAVGRHAEALDALTAAASDAGRIASPALLYVVTAHRMRIHLEQGDMRPVLEWSEDVARGGDELKGYSREPAALTLVRVWLRVGERRRATRLLEQLEKQADVDGRVGSLVEIISLQGLVCWSNGQRDRALGLLARALALAEPGGYMRVFADDGSELVSTASFGSSARPIASRQSLAPARPGSSGSDPR